MFRRFLYIAAAALLFFPVYTAYQLSAQDVTVKKAVGLNNPSLLFSGISTDANMSALVLSDLKNCGWFDLVGGGNADYKISGYTTGGTLTLSVTGRETFSITQQIDNTSPNWTAHRAVDQVLKKLFKIPGICSTRIAFCIETAKGVKEIYVCDFDGKNARRVTVNNSLSVEPDWSPNNRTLAYTVYRGNDVQIAETDILTNRSRILVGLPGLNSGIAYSPDARSIALILSCQGAVDLYVKTAGAAPVRITKDNAVEASPCWAPDARQICYVSDKAKIGVPRLYVTGAGGGSSRMLDTLGSEAVSPSWSPDGTQIAYSAKMGGSYAIAVIDLKNSSRSRTATNMGGSWESPSWAPDSRHVVCSAGGGLYIVDTWTGKARPVLGGYRVSMPAWSHMF